MLVCVHVSGAALKLKHSSPQLKELRNDANHYQSLIALIKQCPKRVVDDQQTLNVGYYLENHVVELCDELKIKTQKRYKGNKFTHSNKKFNWLKKYIKNN